MTFQKSIRMYFKGRACWVSPLIVDTMVGGPTMMMHKNKENPKVFG